MIRFSLLRKAILVAACLIYQHSIAQTTAPAEQKTAQIKRTATSQNVLTGTLTKNLFKTETYQAPYTVQVPYQAEETYTVEIPYEDTETYTVEVPYQVDETYTIEVPYQDTETYTENVAYTIEVPYTEWVTEYRQEYKCTDVTRYRQECRNEQKCYLVPGTGGQQCRMVEECGTNVHGQRICKTRQVCTDNPAQQRCDTHQVCSNVPYTDRDCRYENVPYQTQVTKYRSETRYRQETRTRTVTRYRNETRTRTVTKTRTETRTRTVTKYRTETRTRTVTKYRDEQRCCETKTREVFDRQIQFQVEVAIPQDAQLLAGETETLNINLVSADANTAKVDLKVVNSVYGYRIANQSATGAVIRVELALVPKFDLTNAGSDSIESLKIEWSASAQKFQVSFSDKITSAHVKNEYALVISDLASGAELEQLTVSALANGKLGALVTAVADPQAKIKATLAVKRSGIIVAGNEIRFESSATYEKRTAQASDVATISTAKSISTTLSGSGANSAIVIDDAASAFADIKTTYQIYLDLVVGGASKPLNEKTFTSDQVKAMNGAVKMSDIIGASKHLKAGNKISYTMVVKRTSTSNVLAGKTIKFEKEQAFTLQ